MLAKTPPRSARSCSLEPVGSRQSSVGTGAISDDCRSYDKCLAAIVVTIVVVVVARSNSLQSRAVIVSRGRRQRQRQRREIIAADSPRQLVFVSSSLADQIRSDPIRSDRSVADWLVKRLTAACVVQ